MTLSMIAGMFGVMLALAIIPDSSALVVSARSIASGFKQGLFVVLGIVVGDFFFLLCAVFGLAAIAEYLTGLFEVIKYLGAAYLIGMGLLLLKTKSNTVELKGVEELSGLSNFMSGLMITLADPKAILFYLSFLPAFVDLEKISIADIGIIMATVVVALCCTKLLYAFMADRSRLLFQSSRARKGLNIVAGCILIVTGIFLLMQM